MAAGTDLWRRARVRLQTACGMLVKPVQVEAESYCEGKREVSRNLPAMDMDYAALAKVTWLSESELKSLIP